MIRTTIALVFASVAVFVGACSSDGDNLTDRMNEAVGESDPPTAPAGDQDGDGTTPSGDAAPPAADPEDAGADGAAKPKEPPFAPSPVPGYKVTYPYGVKNSNYAAGYHTGDDYAAPTGAKLVAVRNGTIRWSNDNGGAYGKWIGLDADNGRTYVYCHLSVRSVGVGTKVKAGQAIGKVGGTGNVTGPHLHFEDHPLGPFKYGDDRKPSWGNGGSSGGQCVAGGNYCGGNKLKGDPNVLYECEANGSGSVVMTCANGCYVAPAGQDDKCL